MKFPSLFLSAALLVICFHESGRADLTVSIFEEGNNVVVRSEGSVDTADFFLDFATIGNPFGGGFVQPSENFFDLLAGFDLGTGLIVGPNVAPGADPILDLYSLDYGSSFDGPTFFAEVGTARRADFGNGDTHGFFIQNRVLYLPLGYQSGEFLSGEMTFVDTTLAEFRILPGNYQWQTPNNTFTLSVAPPAITHVPVTLAGDSPVSGAGDINGDGVPDLIVSGLGDANVLSGIDRSVLFNLNFQGTSSGELFGESLSDAGDVNGDGVPDLIVGAPNDDNNGFRSGSVQVFSGSDGAVLYTFLGDSAGDQFGRSVSGAGDVNGDGFADLIVGAPEVDNYGGGSARVFSGVDGSVLYTFDGDSSQNGSSGDSLGTSVSGAGDINGDGFDDVIVGIPFDDNSVGSAQVFSGLDGSVLYTFNGDSFGDRFGASVSGAGDVNGDGVPDLIVGAKTFESFEFGARVFSGVDGAVLHTFGRARPQGSIAVSGAGDVNDDGYADLIVGEDDDDSGFFGGFSFGAARVYSGVNGSLLYDFGPFAADYQFSDLFGGTVSGAGDVNGDGIADFIAGGEDFSLLYISQDNRVLKGDVDLDGDVDFGDIPSFVGALQAGVLQAEADCSCNGSVGFEDIPPFIDILIGQ